GQLQPVAGIFRRREGMDLEGGEIAGAERGIAREPAAGEQHAAAGGDRSRPAVHANYGAAHGSLFHDERLDRAREPPRNAEIERRARHPGDERIAVEKADAVSVAQPVDAMLDDPARYIECGPERALGIHEMAVIDAGTDAHAEKGVLRQRAREQREG